MQKNNVTKEPTIKNAIQTFSNNYSKNAYPQNDNRSSTLLNPFSTQYQQIYQINDTIPQEPNTTAQLIYYSLPSNNVNNTTYPVELENYDYISKLQDPIISAVDNIPLQLLLPTLQSITPFTLLSSNPQLNDELLQFSNPKNNLMNNVTLNFPSQHGDDFMQVFDPQQTSNI